PNLPFHPEVRAGDFIFISGQVAKDADGNMISGTIEDETRGTIEAIRRILAEEGRHYPMSCASRPISAMPATSAATTGYSESTSRMPCWRAPPSRHEQSSIPRSKWTPLHTSRVAGELVCHAANRSFDARSENRSAAHRLRRM